MLGSQNGGKLFPSKKAVGLRILGPKEQKEESVMGA